MQQVAVSRSGRTTLYESPSGFFLSYTPSGQTCFIGTGIGLAKATNGKPLAVGSTRFYEVLRDDLYAHEEKWLEQHYPEYNE